jgi:signal transduction histidine kinase
MARDVTPGDTADRRLELESARLRIAQMREGAAGSLGAALRAATEIAARALAVERVGIWLFVGPPAAIRCCELYELSRDQHSSGTLLHASEFPAYFRALEEQRAISAHDAQEDGVTKELRDAYLTPLGITSMLDAAIYRDGRIAGIVCHEHVGSPRRWTPEEADFAGAVADMVAAKLEAAARRDAEALLAASETSLLDAHRMEALGRLAAGAAHDFQNLLTVVIANAHHIAGNRDATPQIAEQARQILEAGNRSADLSRELLKFGRGEPRSPRVIDVAEIAERMRGILRTGVGSRHAVEVEPKGSPGRVFMDRGQLERILVNLVLNARDAMPGGGTITVRVAASSPDDSGAPVTHVLLEVHDTGIGMDATTRARIFEPFFTTKGGAGSGLGLSIVYRIVTDCGGFIRVESEPGRGTRFRVFLPRVGGGTKN